MRDEIDKAFETLQRYCGLHGIDCENCRFLDEEECCIFGTIAPWTWKNPEKGESYAADRR